MPETYGAYDWVTKVGDTEPPLEVTLTDGDYEPKDLTNAQGVDFHMADPHESTAKVDAAAAIDDAANGAVSYSWADPDTDTAGEYEGEFEVTWADGDDETFPKAGYLDIKIIDPLA